MIKIKEREMKRLEVEVPPAGNPFLGSATLGGSDSSSSKFGVRVVEGHSFLSGFPGMVFFDGELTLEFQYLNRGYVEKLTAETFSQLVASISELYPNRFITPNLAKHTVTLGLLTTTETPVDVSSGEILGQLAERFSIDKENLQAQAKWRLVAK